jgi:alpha-tubulin suppressor-like RCC1 family protein
VSNVAKLSFGDFNGCVVLTSGSELCWGYNEYGEVGDGSSGGGTDALTPRAVAQLSHVVDLSVGYYHSLALLRNGATKAWGYNGDGELGNGTTTNSPTPVNVS